MASLSNKEGNEEVFKWIDEDACTLCEVCLVFIRENGKAQFFKWKEILLDVERRIGRAFNNSNSCKHKYDTMRRDYRFWKALKNSETGLGWDPVSGKIGALNEWWQRKIKVQKQPATKDNSAQIKRTKRQSTRSVMFAKGIGEMA
ncbi:hypothetical protein RDABS01_001263 [Bienertia sinuspersici]